MNLEKVKSNSDKETLMEDTTVTVKYSQVDIKNEKSVDDKIKNDDGKNTKFLDEDVTEEIECINESIVEEHGENKVCGRKEVEDVKKTENEDQNNVDDAEKNKDEEDPSVGKETTFYDDYDYENEKILQQKVCDTYLIGFVPIMSDLLMDLTLENFQTLEEEITNFKYLTQWDMNRIVEMFFEKVKDTPELSDSLAVFMRKIADFNSRFNNLPDSIISVCEDDFEEKIHEKIIFIGSLYKRSLLPETFMKKCIQHFTHKRTDIDVENLRDLLDIVGETPEF